jgi:O-antigen ligase
MYEGMTMVKENPLMGVGADCFTYHHYMTAHNAYVLTAAELGLVGMLLWIAILYTSIKIPIVALLRTRDGSAPQDVRHWAMSVLAALVGTYVGVFFLSFTWHYMLWCYKALAGALYRALAAHDPELRVRFGFVDWVAVAAITVAMALGLYALTRLMVHW